MSGKGRCELMGACVFCSRNEGHICSSCAQKILFMDEGQLRRAHALALEKGRKEKAEILARYMEEVFEDEGSDTVERSAIRARGLRGFRNEKRSTGPFEKRKRFPFR